MVGLGIVADNFGDFEDVAVAKPTSRRAPMSAPVVDHSVVAVVCESENRGDELVFDYAQRGGADHGRFVAVLVCGLAAGVERLDGQDAVGPAPGGVHDLGVHLAFPVVIRYDRDTRGEPV